MGRYAAAVACLLAACAATGCADGARSDGGEASWAREADEVVALLADAYDLADPYQTARFFSAGGTLDLTIWGEDVATTPGGVADAVQRLWFFDAGLAEVEPEHLFVSPDGAVVWWFAYSTEQNGGQDWVQSYSFGARSRIASRAFKAIEVGFTAHSSVELTVAELADRYVEAWNAKDPDLLTAVYAPEVVVRDDIRGAVWRGVEELTADLDDTPPIAPGPWPRVFIYESGNHVEAIVLVQLGGDCPMLEARRWVLDGDRIIREMRFTHVPSARRCLSDLPEGWWTTFDLPPDLQYNVTEVVDVGGSLVELINAEPRHEEFVRWLFAKYIESGIGFPEVGAVWFPPAPECADLGGLAIEADERYEGRHTVVICFGEDRLESDRSESGWDPTAIAYGLHELAHIWDVDNLTDETRAEFNERAGLRVWRGTADEARWDERGMEHAAFTIAWGLGGTVDARYPILPVPECEELAARFVLLTGRQPATTCGADGWSPP